jgi:hypothetical protein
MNGEANLNSTDIRDIRKFGIIALIFFGILCTLGLWFKKPIPTYLFGFLSIMGLGFILNPLRLRPLYSGWMKIAHLMGRIVTTLILTLAYYLVITPSALIKRVFGGRPLPLKPDKSVSSYWVARTEPVQPKERFLKRY